MSLPNYLASIKSSGFYRFVWDKSTVPVPQASTMRMVIGYSETGPFNTPVYINNVADFTTTYGNGSKRMERKGIYFHRLAQQALTTGPILALNLKPFKSDSEGDKEKISYITFSGNEVSSELSAATAGVRSVYNTNRFWSIDPDQLPVKLRSTKYMTIASTDSKETSCTVFIRKSTDVSRSYDLTFREWYAATNEEVPHYIDHIMDENMKDYFMDIFVFRGEFNKAICGDGGILSEYFDVDEEEPANITLKDVTSLDKLAGDENSNFLYKYQGITLPYFKDAMGYYISIDILLNKDNYDHKLLMKLDESILDNDTEINSNSTLNNAVKVTEANGKMVYLPGYDYKSLSFKSTASNIVDSIIKVIETEKGIRTALTNNVDVEYHYLVDTFGSYADSSSAKAKARLSLLAKEKDNTFAILNFPTIQSFIDASHNTPNFDMKEVTTLFSLPAETQGASWCAFFTQLLFSDGTVKNYIPSAGLVSNNFLAKWGGRQPYYIVAGPNYGVINYTGMVGPDYAYGRADLDVLEPYGVNVIIYVPRKGSYINSNQTAKQKPVSALSKIHVRELVIYLQNEIEYMLQNYQWELNTQPLRDVIKKKADYILENIKDNGGIYAYKSICDETNNTPEVIDNEMIVLDIEIEPARGAGKMVSTLTIHRTGGISSQSK